uniref:Uncharacterized protein n=1 Tax=Glossina brevipalpis TaxID=37001 RepID=A0A1A9X402_9MUSC
MFLSGFRKILKCIVTYLLGFVLGLKGAPVFNFALGYCDKYVIIDCSSTLGLTNSSGLISCLTFNQSSARPIASEAFCTASLESHISQSGHKPGAQASTKAPTALPVVQSLFVLTFVWELNRYRSIDFRLHHPTLALKWNNSPVIKELNDGSSAIRCSEEVLPLTPNGTFTPKENEELFLNTIRKSMITNHMLGVDLNFKTYTDSNDSPNIPNNSS